MRCVLARSTDAHMALHINLMKRHSFPLGSKAQGQGKYLMMIMKEKKTREVVSGIFLFLVFYFLDGNKKNKQMCCKYFNVKARRSDTI